MKKYTKWLMFSFILIFLIIQSVDVFAVPDNTTSIPSVMIPELDPAMAYEIRVEAWWPGSDTPDAIGRVTVRTAEESYYSYAIGGAYNKIRI